MAGWSFQEVSKIYHLIQYHWTLLIPVAREGYRLMVILIHHLIVLSFRIQHLFVDLLLQAAIDLLFHASVPSLVSCLPGPICPPRLLYLSLDFLSPFDFSLDFTLSLMPHHLGSDFSSGDLNLLVWKDKSIQVNHMNQIILASLRRRRLSSSPISHHDRVQQSYPHRSL